MLAEDRFAKILSIVDTEGSVTVTTLVERLGASESTVRRDLAVMDHKGLLSKVHGGAVSLRKRPELSARDENVVSRKAMFAEDKGRIARYAASLIRPDDFVFLDAGTTTEMIIDYVEASQAVFVTHAVSHALKLAARGFRVHLLGGELKSVTETAVGEETLEALDRYRFTRGFWGTNGITAEDGFFTPDPREAQIKAKSMRQCRECYVLADESKFSAVSNVRFARFEEAQIITNRMPEGEWKRYPNLIITG